MPYGGHARKNDLRRNVFESYILQHTDIIFSRTKMNVGFRQPLPGVILNSTDPSCIGTHPYLHVQLSKPSMQSIDLSWVHNYNRPSWLEDSKSLGEPHSLVIPVPEGKKGTNAIKGRIIKWERFSLTSDKRCLRISPSPPF